MFLIFIDVKQTSLFLVVQNNNHFIDHRLCVSGVQKGCRLGPQLGKFNER